MLAFELIPFTVNFSLGRKHSTLSNSPSHNVEEPRQLALKGPFTQAVSSNCGTLSTGTVLCGLPRGQKSFQLQLQWLQGGWTNTNIILPCVDIAKKLISHIYMTLMCR